MYTTKMCNININYWKDRHVYRKNIVRTSKLNKSLFKENERENSQLLMTGKQVKK